ncbi:conjugal transfer protein TraI, partial [Escherichia coli]|nr:conjugal transfer protein TraI [Escherichia coli]
ILLIAALFVIIILFKVLSREQVVQQTPLEKSDETLVTNTNNGVSLTTMMKNIEEKEKLDAANRRKAQEEQEQKQADNAPSAPASQKADQTAVNVIANGTPQTASGDPNQPQPLPKSVRQLMGDTMVKIDNQEQGEKNQERDDLQGSQYADGKVSPVLNRRYLLSAGTALSCVLKTKIVTSYPGITMCQLTRDVWSDNGEVLLARKGALLIGEQNKVMTQGVARVFVNWTTLKDENVNVRIGALG